MKRCVIYFIDEDESARRANCRSLNSLLDCQDIEVVPLAPFRSFAEYNSLLVSPAVAAFILDQRMKTSGVVSYNGTDLARHLRGIDSKIPIYILTGYADQKDDFVGSEHLVEYILDKEHIEDRTSDEAVTIRSRLLRHLNVHCDVRDSQSSRFNDLIVKGMRETLSKDEQVELDQLEGVISAPVAASERVASRELGEIISELKRLVDK